MQAFAFTEATASSCCLIEEALQNSRKADKAGSASDLSEPLCDSRIKSCR